MTHDQQRRQLRAELAAAVSTSAVRRPPEPPSTRAALRTAVADWLPDQWQQQAHRLADDHLFDPAAWRRLARKAVQTTRSKLAACANRSR